MNQKSIQDLINFGIINIDKPSGPTSFSVTDYIRKSLNLNKTSHMGTLDPQVSGVLPILLGRACRLSDYFMHKDKTYVGIMRIHQEIDEKSLQKHMNKFVGKITQLPPVRSRVKRAEREREVKTFKILEKEGKDVLFIAEVQAGTYIRKICSDLGEKIGGAHMIELRRTQAGIFNENTTITLYEFDKATEEYKKGNEEPLRKVIVDAEQAIKKVMPFVQLHDKNIKKLLTGKPLMQDDVIGSIPDSSFAAFSKDKFIGIYKPSQEGDIIARAEFVKN